MLLYVDDCLTISVNPKRIIENEIGKYFQMKYSLIGEPDIYLGGKVRKKKSDFGVEYWTFSSLQYVQGAVDNVQRYLKKLNADRESNERKSFIPKKASAPFRNDYRPEVDVSPELDPEMALYYNTLIFVLRWMVELDRVNITTEVSMMSSCLALPREGHLQALLHMMWYLEKKHNAVLEFDPSEPDIDFDH